MLTSQISQARQITKAQITLAETLRNMRRDRNEPDVEYKLRLQRRLFRAVMRHWRRQRERIHQRLELWYPSKKAATPTIPVDTLWEDDPEFEGEVIRILLADALGGIDAATLTVGLSIDYTLPNLEAAKWVRKYAFDLIKGITQTSKRVVQEALNQFVGISGYTIGDVINTLPFSPVRAQMIATTEITRAYAQGQLIAGRAMAKEYPDVRVVKRWWTNKDGLVCAICQPLHGVEVGIEEQFPGGMDEPPAHVNCRCWISTRTRIGSND